VPPKVALAALFSGLRLARFASAAERFRIMVRSPGFPCSGKRWRAEVPSDVPVVELPREDGRSPRADHRPVLSAD
jgi:hypothetical protein